MDARTAVVLESRPMSPPAAPVHPVTPLNELARAEAAPSFSPLYRQIKGLILKGLQAGEWKAGETIPSEMDLAARFGVSQGTVRKAVDELAADNLLVRKQGKGTFVATHAEQQQQYRFLRLTPDGDAAASLGRQLLDCKRQRAPAFIAKLMQLRAGDPVIEIRRLLHSGGQPVVLVERLGGAVEPLDQQVVRPIADGAHQRPEQVAQRGDALARIAVAHVEAAPVVPVGLVHRAQLVVAHVAVPCERGEHLALRRLQLRPRRAGRFLRFGLDLRRDARHREAQPDDQCEERFSHESKPLSR